MVQSGCMDGNGNDKSGESRAKAAARAASWQAWGALLGIAVGYAAPWVMPWMFRSIFADKRNPAALAAVGAGFFAWAWMLGHGRRIWRREVAGKEEEKGWRRGWKFLVYLLGFLLVGIALLVAGSWGSRSFLRWRWGRGWFRGRSTAGRTSGTNTVGGKGVSGWGWLA